MDIVLSPVEVRVLGCLIEKEATTPDTYPLSLNALTAACNQKSNREPVMSISESTVLDTVETLIGKTLVTPRSGAGSRVSKFAHRFSDRLLDELSFSRPELALLGVLFLRGPQTPGELRSRCTRIHSFQDTTELLATLRNLEQRSDGPYVTKLPTQPGQKEARYAHLFAGEVQREPEPAGGGSASTVSDEAARVAELELRVSDLRNDLDALRAEFEDYAKRFR